MNIGGITMGMTMISNEEYKELILAQDENEYLDDALNSANKRLNKRTMALNGLLLMLTKGARTTEWKDRKFEPYDLASNTEIADYLNAHYVKDGILQLKENNND